MTACDDCVRRAWLLRRLAGHLEPARARIDELLRLPDGELIAAVGGRRSGDIRRERARVVPSAQRALAAAVGIETVCRCDAAYPPRLHALDSPPAVLHVAGGLARFLTLVAGVPVAIVGARSATAYGLDMARALGRELAGAGITVLSGLALGIDSAAHAGALAAPAAGAQAAAGAAAPGAASAGAPAGATIAVLPGPPDRPYPAGRKWLYRQIVARGNAISELPPGAEVRRWSFPARNRIIAGLAAVTVVVEAGARSGALLTAAQADATGRPVGAVPGRVTTPQAAGSNALLAGGARVIRDAQDVLDQLFGAGAVTVGPEPRPPLCPEARTVLKAIAGGQDTAAALGRAGMPAERRLAVLASLELDGYVTRGPGGRFRAVP